MINQTDQMSGLRSVVRAAFVVLSLTLIGLATRAQDFSGDWNPPVTLDNNEDAAYGNYTGIPLNNPARLRAESWDESILSLTDWQCKPHGAVYVLRAPQGRLRIQREYSPITGQFVAFSVNAGGTTLADRYVIYMDGRPDLSDLAPHSWFGSSRGAMQGSVLKFTTTHLKEDTSRRLGVPSSNVAVLTQYLIRHGDYLIWIYIDNDRVYLTEPMIRSMDFRLNPAPTVNMQGAAAQGPGCTVVEESELPHGHVPHFIPSENTYFEEYAKKYNLPLDFALGGADTMYPEYQRKLIRLANEPKK